MTDNTNLHRSKKNKNDEYYTLYKDVEAELSNYDLSGEVIYLNCDSDESNFWKFLCNNFKKLGIKKVLRTCYSGKDKFEYESYDGIYKFKMLDGNGDFGSEQCLDLVNECTCLITNPPWSLANEYLEMCAKSGKKFLILTNINCAKYKNIFPYIKEGKMWAGVNNRAHLFRVPDDYEHGRIKVIDGIKYANQGNSAWWTNMDNSRRHQSLTLNNASKDEMLDNYDALCINKTKDIFETDKVMAVPVSFLTKHNPEQFEIVGELNHGSDNKYDYAKPIYKGKELFPRILIKKVVK